MSSFYDLHKNQLAEIPRIYWKSLQEKVENEIFDAGDSFSLMLDDEDNYHAIVKKDDGIKQFDPANVFLIDHALTYEAEHFEAILQKFPQLLQRMAHLMDIDCTENFIDDEKETLNVLKEVVQKQWKYNASYFMRKTANIDGEMVIENPDDDKLHTPLWYILDEFGSRIQHSTQPNVAFRHFFYVNKSLSLTVMYPLKDIEHEEEIYRNYIEHCIGNDLTKSARLYPWFKSQLIVDSIKDEWTSKLREKASSEDRCSENVVSSDSQDQAIVKKDVFKLYSNYHYVPKHLSCDAFQLVENEDEADILFLSHHFKDFTSHPHKYINQFPNEKILLCKDLFAETAMRYITYKYQDDKEIPENILTNRGPLWIPTTFNMFTELPQFIKCFKEREIKKLDNTWIVKPWNLARSLDHTVSKNLDQIIRLAETGPKVVSKYLDDPLLYFRQDIGWVKQDYRFVVYVTSAQPLRCYIHKVFWIRFGNKPFDLTDLYDFQKHYTHMWYKGAKLLEVPYNEYIDAFHEMYPQFKWADVQNNIYKCIKELMVAATTESPPNGLGRSNRCRAFYGIDLMLRWKDKDHTEIQPILLEANFNSDITRACRDMPYFVDEMFELFFLDKVSDNFILL